jgi:hypothetical protein
VPWVYLDDHWDEHPKILTAYAEDPLAPTLFISSMTYCRRSSPDGIIPGPKVRGLLGWRAKAQRALLAAELWHHIGPGETMEIHDWRDWNHGAEARTASARNAAQIKWKRAKGEPA